MEHLTYQQVLADHYEETAKTVLVIAHEYEEEVPPHEKNPKEELEDQEDFQKFTPRHDPETITKPPAHEDKTKLSIFYDKQTQVRLINIDSRYRNNYGNSLSNIPSIAEKEINLFTNSSSSDFIFKLREPIKNVISVRLSSIEFPNSFYTFSRARGNVLFEVTYPTSNPQSYILEIPAGNWTSDIYDPALIPAIFTGTSNIYSSPSILWKITFTFNNWFQNPGNLPGPVYQLGPTKFFVADYIDPGSGRIQLILNDGTLGPIPFFINWKVPSSSISDNGTVDYLTYPMNPRYTQSRQASKDVADFGLGYNLGFRQGSYLLTAKSIPAEAIINTIDTNYIFLTLDDDWKVIEQETPDRTLLFSFAKIVIDVPKFDIVYDNGANTLTKEYYLKQPTNIHTIPVRVSDPYDQDIDLNGLDFSFTLELREVISAGLYESMRS